MAPRKYLLVDGTWVPNPEHPDNKPGARIVPTAPPEAIIAPYGMADLIDFASTTQHTSDHLDRLMADTVVGRFGHTADSAIVVDGLSAIFAEYEVPFGMISKLTDLIECHLDFIVDDSGSMSSLDSVLRDGTRVTRWVEARERLMIFMRILAYIPACSITVSFFNRSTTLNLTHEGERPEKYLVRALAAIEGAFRAPPSGGTPTYRVLEQHFKVAALRDEKTLVYMFTDGEPDSGPGPVESLLMRRNAAKMPFTFLSCTGNDANAEWMKEIEDKPMPNGSPSYLSESDDYKSERREVLHDQGDGIPYTYGFWLICQLAAANNPYDLDMLDEGPPMTKMTLDNLIGRKTTFKEYEAYFNLFLNNKHKTLLENIDTKRRWGAYFANFSREDVQAHELYPVQKYIWEKSLEVCHLEESACMIL